MMEKKDTAMLRQEVAEHYEHARRKHPYFADELFLERDAFEAARALARMRRCLDFERRERKVVAETVLNCEIAEAAYAFASADKHHAVAEIHDAIAVLLRMVDVIEGRQALGEGDAE